MNEEKTWTILLLIKYCLNNLSILRKENRYPVKGTDPLFGVSLPGVFFLSARLSNMG